ncbi:MAG: SH3 domain-containing protein [Clostridia bacterium]|nr:SH3 domain-containing protein [Clostridia bacterium]MBR4458113.1 SH3 domain-containing protein [Clostridia bacterium]
MRKLAWIVLAVTLIAMLPLHAMADSWYFIGEQTHCRYEGGPYQRHTYNGGNVCTQCGHKRAVQSQSGGFNPDILLNTCIIQYKTKVYREPDFVGFIGQASVGDYYAIADYTFVGDNAWILLQKKENNQSRIIGWVVARDVKVDMANHYVENDMIGKKITVKANSAKLREYPGTEYRQIGSVRYKDTFTVLDQAIGSNGNTWYLIKVENVYGWLAAGLTY